MNRDILFSFLIILTLTISLVLWSYETLDNCNPNFEFSGIAKFYQIIDILKQNNEPSDEQWNNLFETPGYKSLMKTLEGKMFKKLMILSYMPGKDEEKKEILEKMIKQENKFWELFTKNSFEVFNYSEKNKEAIFEIIDDFNKYPFTEVALKEALKFLPENSVDEVPSVSFIIFPDSRGSDPICISINNQLIKKSKISNDNLDKINNRKCSWERISAYVFAHEFFHYYRDKDLDFIMPDRDSDDFDLVWIINQIENEGVAEQINVKQLYFEGGYFSETKKTNDIIEEQKKQPNMIIALDSLMSQSYNNISERKKINKKIRNMIPRSGHPLGFFMANIIIEHLGKDLLIKVVRNPFAFFRFYNTIAIDNEMIPEFSKDAMQYIYDMEKKYLIDE